MKTAPGLVTEVIKNIMSGVKLLKAGLRDFAYQIASSCSEHSLQDYSL